ncbi:DUF1027 domain-containing protein [Paenibacillus nanensis]|uniref:DUF1027 domain-containing protein n=1 Tax=Paenibacillus nanensis TaxID=393251 RepID=A0A3A1UYR3_9BACL|nr:DUF1027 domain-containing protein [Paenibacillus nanensis]
MIHIGGKSYELIHENKGGWNPEAFRNRYSEVLERYDYIIGDWGYNQLRLKGFFRDNHQKATKDSAFSTVSDYIIEYCNFGCAYFILEKKHGGRSEPGEDDLDLDVEYGDDAVRLEGYDLRAAVESAAEASAAETASAAEAPKAAPREQRPNRHRQHQRQEGGGRSASGRNDSQPQQAVQSQPQSLEQGGSGQALSGQQGQTGGQGQGQGQGRRKDHHFRNKNNRGGDHRGKKPVKAASSEVGAAAEPNRGTEKNKSE